MCTMLVDVYDQELVHIVDVYIFHFITYLMNRKPKISTCEVRYVISIYLDLQSIREPVAIATHSNQ